MKKSVFFLLALTAGLMLKAQTFTAVNSEGVSIKYNVISANSVEVSRDSYTGRVVVPEQVSYEGTDYNVTKVGAWAFYNCSAHYVELPESVVELGRMCFSTTSLDSVRFTSIQPPSVGNSQPGEFFGSQQVTRIKVIVPCGQLENWKRQGWDQLTFISSECAYRLSVAYNYDSIMMVYAGGMYGTSLFMVGDRYSEAGDTAVVALSRFSWTENGAERKRYGYFLGWSDGGSDPQRELTMPDHDLVLNAIVDTMPYATLAASRISTPVFIFGTLGYDGYESNYNFRDIHYANGPDEEVYPSTVFNSSLWMGVPDESVAASLFFNSGSDYFPGPLRMDGTTDIETVLAFSRVWHVTREMIDYHIAHCGEADYVVPDDIMTWPGNGPAGYAEQLAPYYDADGNGQYCALAGDYPMIRGDECVFSIYNDAWSVHASEGMPLGVEVHAMTYAFNEPQDSALWNTVFQHYDIYNRSGQDHYSASIGMWTDFDIGYAWDDYVGCDVRRGMYYGYNGTQQDTPGSGSFNDVLPAQGCLILGGPRQDPDSRDNLKVDMQKILSETYTNQEVKQLLEQYRRDDGTLDTVAVNSDADLFFSYDYNSWYFQQDDITGNQAINGTNFGNGIVDDERLGMTNFTYYENSYNAVTGEPMVAADYINYMSSYWKNGAHIKYGGNGLNMNTEDFDANFMFPGNSDPWWWGTNGVVSATTPVWSESLIGNAPGDRRGVGSCGPFTFSQGACQEMDVAYVTGFGPSVEASVTTLQSLSDDVRRQWQHDTTDSGRPFVYMPYSAPHEVGIVGVENASLQVWPNPTAGLLTVKLPVEADLQVYDMMGRQLMRRHAAEGTLTLDLSSLPQGVYLLRAAGYVSRIVKK